jgi:ATP-dependent DNA helicase RecG
LLQVVRDEEIVISAREAALSCFQDDPNLSEHPQLKQTIEEIEKYESAEFLEKN